MEKQWTSRLTEQDMLAALAGRSSSGCDSSNVRACIIDERVRGRVFYSPVLVRLAAGELDLYTARREARKLITPSPEGHGGHHDGL